MSGFEHDELRLALTFHLVETIITADGEMFAGEVGFLHRSARAEDLVAAGFVDDKGQLTPRFDEARSAALLSLPARLSLKEKLDLLSLCMQAVLADGQADAYELVHLRVAAKILGLSDTQLSAHLDTLADVGSVDDGDLLDDDALEDAETEM